jgi:hypothetical protein
MAQLKKKQVVIFRGYFDETGIEDPSEVTLIAGLLGTPPAMHRIAKEWNKVLRKYGVTVPFTQSSSMRLQRRDDSPNRTLIEAGVRRGAKGISMI